MENFQLSHFYVCWLCSTNVAFSTNIQWLDCINAELDAATGDPEKYVTLSKQTRTLGTKQQMTYNFAHHFHHGSRHHGHTATEP